MFGILFSLTMIHATSFSTEQYHFYTPECTYGSESVFGPANLFINGSFDIFRNGAHTKNVLEQTYTKGFKDVTRNLSAPFHHIEVYGVRNFFRREIFNISTDVHESQFLPNFGLHIIGNGMQYIKLAEWYAYHRYPYPKLLSLLTSISYQYLNEILENGAFQGTNVDPISDMLIFNPLGFLLFSIPWIQAFFSEKVVLLDWSPFPYFGLSGTTIENAGQQYAAKLEMLEKDEFRPFLYWGALASFGVSKDLSHNRCLSVAVGVTINQIIEKRFGNARYMTAALDYGIMIFYDRHNSLLSSLILTGPKYWNLRYELYPNVLAVTDKFKPGFLIGIGEVDHIALGLACSFSPLGIIHKF